MAAFASAAASSSSSRVPCGKYDVFISFRGPDVRYGFLSHLERRLRQENIDVFVDYRIESGEEIAPALVEAIEKSKIALVIFSKDYASSKSCLDELVKIMELQEVKQQIVIPIFHHVDPSHVRNQESNYPDSFTHLGHKFKDDVDKLQIWRSVLKKSSNLRGHHSTKFSDEVKLIDAVVEDVLKKLEDNSPIVSNSDLIGLHKNFSSVESLMKVKPEEVLILGIWGMGGIGKTTLACAIFDKFLSTFKSYHCFIENVREKSAKTNGLNSLRQELVSKLSKQKDDIEINEAMRRLQWKKVLIVVDDVDNPKQLKYLVGQHLCLLGQGSRILVTSRDKRVLKSGGINEKYIHEVNVLNFEESLELFSVHAFNQSQPQMGYQELSKMTVAIAGGIPLALEVLGSHFHSREREYWESELRKLKKCPHRDIQNILKISYDGLDALDKEIFLDIAFFFVGERKGEIFPRLEACGFEAVSGIQNLMDKALIKSQYGYIEMHGLIREMAEQIVRENPETRSRLNDVDELCGMLESNMGTDKIEGIMLNRAKRECLPLGADIFIKMKKLRIIKLLALIKLPCGLDSFPNKLRYLHWYGYPLEYIPVGSCFENLVELNMGFSNVKKLWDGKKDLANLKKINLNNSRQLMELPDFSMAYKLEIVVLSGCINLRSVHPSILSLHTIVYMNVNYCTKLESLESDTHLESLSTLDLGGCFSLKRLCLSSKKLRDINLLDSTVEALHFSNGQCTELRTLSVYGGRLKSLQLDGLCCSTNLDKFKVTGFKQVIDTKELHSLFYAWHNLTYLCLNGWSYLREIPDSIKGLTRLEELSLSGSSVETLPALNDLLNLKYIYLRSSKMLKSILGLPPFLEELDASECTSLETICSGPLFHNHCGLNFFNCVKLDKSSLGFIEITNSSMTSPYIHDKYDEYDEYCLYGTICYPGSRVPEWMKYKQMTEASRAIEFTCNPKLLDGIVLCCIAPGYPISKDLIGFRGHISYDVKNEFFNKDIRYLGHKYNESNSDHVFLWFMESGLLDTRSSNATKISCEFFLEFRNESWELELVPVEACGVHLLYYSELELELKPSQNRKRDANICVEDQLSPTK